MKKTKIQIEWYAKLSKRKSFQWNRALQCTELTHTEFQYEMNQKEKHFDMIYLCMCAFVELLNVYLHTFQCWNMAKYGYLHWVKQMKLVHFFLSGIYWVSSMFNAYASYTFPLRIIACSSSLFLCNTKFYRKKESVIINRFKNLNRPKFRYISRIFNENGSLKQPYLRNGLTDFRFCPISKLA